MAEPCQVRQRPAAASDTLVQVGPFRCKLFTQGSRPALALIDRMDGPRAVERMGQVSLYDLDLQAGRPLPCCAAPGRA
jgi:hypothetical protein